MLDKAQERFLVPKFADEEYGRRHRKVRAAMREQDLECLLVYATGREMYQQNVRYLTGYADAFQAYCIFPLEGDPTVLMTVQPHLPAARLLSSIPDTRWGGPRMADGVVSRLLELGLESGRIGVVNVDSARTLGIPQIQWEVIREGCPQAQFRDVTVWFERMRSIKGEAEITFARKGAEVTDAALHALVKAIRPGVSEHELQAEMLYAGQMAGGVPCFALLGSTPMADPAMPYPWPYPSSRKIEVGDIILNEVSVHYGGVSGQIIRPIAVGAPTDEYRLFHEVAVAVYRRVAEVLRPGATEQDILRAAAPIKEAGLSIEAPIIHGWDNKPGPPFCGIPDDPKWDTVPFTLQEGQLIMIEPNPCTKDLSRGLFFGDLYAITSSGAEKLHSFDDTFIVL